MTPEQVKELFKTNPNGFYKVVGGTATGAALLGGGTVAGVTALTAEERMMGTLSYAF